jgi:hypothetical protein
MYAFKHSKHINIKPIGQSKSIQCKAGKSNQGICSTIVAMAVAAAAATKATTRARTKIKARTLKHRKTLNYRLKY